MMRSISILVLAIGCAAFVPATADAATLADVPLATVSGLPLVEVRVGSSDQPLTFLIDTGFDVSVLDAGTAVVVVDRAVLCLAGGQLHPVAFDDRFDRSQILALAVAEESHDLLDAPVLISILAA